ncbi:c-type cytochrome biogenesis protein CcmI [Oricola sp.]|uniref:c-type cytochrome biogenesis protein CcmI n=1 Tax=Oricola sp. TaxID=1979950 RepID=UPI003BA9CC96
MQFYLAAVSLTILLIGIAFWPIWRRGSAPLLDDERTYDLAIYKDQLSELEADLERGAIAPGEADYARAEIGRRIIAVQDAVDAGATIRASRAMPVVFAAVAFIPLSAALLYSGLGSPSMPGQPLALRADEPRLADMGVNDLVARAEAQLARNPNDGRGWDVLAPMYLRLGRAADAERAFLRAIDLLGDSAARRSGLGQAYFVLDEGVVDDRARNAFSAALAIDENDASAHFFLALAAAQSGDIPAAVAAWRRLTDDDTAAAEWKAAAAEGLRRYDDAMPAAAGATAPRLDEETMSSARAMSQEDRSAMILSMVEDLDSRLREQPDDIAGWQRLIRSYTVLGRDTDAKAALDRATSAFADDPAKRDQIRTFAAALGIAAGETTQ